MFSAIRRVLLVEDHDADAFLVREAMEKEGDLPFILDRVQTLEDAIEFLKGQSVEVVLLDLGLPGTRGLKTLERFRESVPDVAVIVLTGLADDQAAVDALRHGAQDYVEKNDLDGKVLLRAIRYAYERKRIEDEADKSRDRWRLLFEKAPDAYYLMDREGRFAETNEVATTISGYSRDEFMGRTFEELNLVQDSDRERVYQNLSAEESTGPEEYTIRRKDGRFVQIEARTFPVTFDDKTYILGIARDISQRKQMESERLQLAAVIEQATESVLVTDCDGTIQYVNPACLRQVSCKTQDLVGRSCYSLFESDLNGEALQSMERAIRIQTPWNGRLRRKAGLEQPTELEAYLSPIRNEQGAIDSLVLIMRDMTRETQLEQLLRQAQKMEAVGQLAGGVAHDFNNVLQVIMGNAEMASSSYKGNGVVQEALEEIEKTAGRAATLTRQMLAFSRRQVLQMNYLSLNTVLADMMKMLHRVIGEDIKLDFRPGADIGTIHADPNQIEQILMNLCVNGRDAMPGGGTLLIETGTMDVDEDYARDHPWARTGPYIFLTVTDTGAGMTPEVQDRLFEPFFTTKEVGRGTGLGLATVYGIVKQHGGMIHVYSEVNEGSVFKVAFPKVEQQAAVLEIKREAPPTRGNEVIFVAEDDDRVRRLMKKVLESAGYRCIVAADGNEALEELAEIGTFIDMAILDVIMPGKNGKQVYDRLIEIADNIPVLFCSGYSAAALQQRDFPEGKFSLLNKPFQPTVLLKRVRELLDGGSHNTMPVEDSEK